MQSSRLARFLDRRSAHRMQVPGRILGAAVLLALLTGCAVTQSTAQRACSRAETAFVGVDAGRIEALRFDGCEGRLSRLGHVADVVKPRWIVVHPELPVVYAASDDSAVGGRVVAFDMDRASGVLSRSGDLEAGGAGTTHLWLDARSSTLLASNFASGSTSSLSLGADGRLEALVSTVVSTGSGPHRRQTGPHAHGAVVDPGGRFALVADLGADRIHVLGFDRSSHVLAESHSTDERDYVVPPGSGPHHVAFGRDGRFVYLLNELSADVTVLRWDAASGHLAPVQVRAISTPGFESVKSGAEIDVGRDGRFVYVANRAENTLIVYRADSETGVLSPVQTIASGGATPWSFAIHPSGRWMLVVNQRGNNVSLFAIDARTGQLSATGQAVDMPMPLSVTFAR